MKPPTLVQGWIACRRGDAVGGRWLLDKARELAGGQVSWEIEEHLATCAAHEDRIRCRQSGKDRRRRAVDRLDVAHSETLRIGKD